MVTQISSSMSVGSHVSGDANLSQLEIDLKKFLAAMQACQKDINNGGQITQDDLVNLQVVLNDIDSDMGNMSSGSFLDQEIAANSTTFSELGDRFSEDFTGKGSLFADAASGNLDGLTQAATYIIDAGTLSNYQSAIQNFISNPLGN